MDISKSFEIAHPIDAVWRALSDVHLVAACLPGAAITEQLGAGRHKGRFQVKAGPMAATFAGEVAIETREGAHTATVSGKGADARSSSRASGTMTYRLTRAGDAATRVEVESNINLAGALAQFGKAAVVQEIANRITVAFVANLDARLKQERAAAPVSPVTDALAAPRGGDEMARPLDAGNLLWSILRDRVVAWIRRLFGRGSAHI